MDKLKENDGRILIKEESDIIPTTQGCGSGLCTVCTFPTWRFWNFQDLLCHIPAFNSASGTMKF